MSNRRATVNRKTGETEITMTFDLEGTGKYEVSTGNGFLDHMPVYYKHLTLQTILLLYI